MTAQKGSFKGSRYGSQKASKAARFAGFSLSLLVAGTPAFATDFTAGVVMAKMKPEERYPYISGVVEGLAYSRFVRDEKKTEGMGCIYDWFYKEPKTIDLIYVAFGKFPDHLPGAVIAALAKRKCGE